MTKKATARRQLPKRASLRNIWLRWRFYLLLLAIFLIPRTIDLGRDITNIDADRWHERSYQFIRQLSLGRIERTYQTYHPGVTVQWLSGLGQHTFLNLFEWSRGYDPRFLPKQYPLKHFACKFPLVVAISLLGVFGALALEKIFNRRTALFFAVFLSLEPHFLGTSRFLHLSALTAALMFAAFMSLTLYGEAKKRGYLVLSAALLSLAALTKTNGMTVAPLLALMLWGISFKRGGGKIGGGKGKPRLIFDRQSWRRFLIDGSLFLAVFVLIFFALFPSMWIKPKWTVVDKLIGEGILGTAFSDAGGDNLFASQWLYYPTMLFFKASPVLILLSFYYLINQLTYLLGRRFRKGAQWVKDWWPSQSRGRFLLATLGFFLLNYVVLSIPSKTKDRYLMPFYFPLAVWSALAAEVIFKRLPRRIFWLGVALAAVFYGLVAWRYHPNYSFYVSDLIGGPPGLTRLGVNVPNRGEFYTQVANFLNEKDQDNNPYEKNTIIYNTEYIRTFKYAYKGKAYTREGNLPEGADIHYYVSKDYSLEHIPEHCRRIKTFGNKAPFAYNLLYLYECTK